MHPFDSLSIFKEINSLLRSISTHECWNIIPNLLFYSQFISGTGVALFHSAERYFEKSRGS